MEDELWIKKIKEQLEDYSEPMPSFGWKRLEKELSASDSPVIDGRRAISFRRWAAVAAASLLIAVSSVSLWLLQSSVGDEVRHTNVPALAVVPDVLPEQPASSGHAGVAEPFYKPHGNSAAVGISGRSLVAQQVGTSGRKELKGAALEEDVTDICQVAEPVVSHKENIDTKKVNESEKTQTGQRWPSGKDKLQLPIERESDSRSRGWSVGMGVGNAGGLVNGVNQHGSAFNSGKLDLMATADGIVAIPEGQEVFFKDGLPYLKKQVRSIESINHKQPLSFGLSLRKNLKKSFSLETGLTYTYLASDVKFDDSLEKVGQKLHYIGIPVRVNWNFVEKNPFTMYVSAGGAVEKCVYGKIGSDNATVKPLQFSVMGAVGVQYNVNNRVGLYMEPGVSYFFDDGSDVQTIRKENPCNFTLQAGIRLTY
ncbi:porin family protein [Bacteroides helcogenes]|uniref:Outer membrane protein beta-barrel domain-containing protein n=1 Tax=Bacteroides helcogenes (strain ATCC 35417 / DSM 20613 / JCM 6297 / CCUG 15421 / P 36-108) TaxID=693979 RepID=E6SP16_BACT6|nr:porin family protein [Bacteroides helcogenes]ADV43786.1 hypothetical protein Bache_1804 [Bacteroides helcogenes P 36-108]MDY5237417.1 porin family protein [Bacteroides helcogenes]